MNVRDLHRDERGLVVSWLVRLLIGLVLTAVVLFDAGSIAINYFSVNDSAEAVATAVTTDLASGVQATPNLSCARRSTSPLCRQAYAIAREKGVKIVSAHFDQGGTFHIEVRKTAGTLIVGRIGAIEDWAKATASAEAETNTN